MNSKLKNTIINYLRSEYKDLDIITTKSYPNCIFYTQNGRVIFDYNKKYNCSFINPEISSLIDSFFELSDYHKHQVLRIWIDIMIGISPGSIVEDELVSKLRWMEIQS